MNDVPLAATATEAGLVVERLGSFEALFKAHANSLAKVAYLITGDRQAAEDVVQEVFLEYWRRAEDLRPEGAVAYLRRAVVNRSASILRKRRVAQAVRFGFKASETLVASSEESFFDGRGDPEMRQALAGLALRQREVLVLRYFMDLSYEEIGATLNISLGSVKSTVSRGLAALARRLKTEER